MHQVAINQREGQQVVKIHTQKALFKFINIMSFLLLVTGICGGMTIDKSMFYILFISLGMSGVSCLLLINKIYYNEKEIRFDCACKKATIPYEDIKEIFIQKEFVGGITVIFNLEKTTDGPCIDYKDYMKKCKSENIRNTIFLAGLCKKDIVRLLEYCRCEKKGVHF